MLFNFQPFEPYSHASSNRSITKMKPVLKELWPGTANHFFLYKWRSNFHPQLVQNAKKKRKKRKVFKTIAKWMWCSPIVWADFWIYSSLINIPDLYNSDPKYTFSWTQTTKLFSGVKQNQTKRRNHIQPVAKRNWRGITLSLALGWIIQADVWTFSSQYIQVWPCFYFTKTKLIQFCTWLMFFPSLRCLLGNYSAFKKIEISQSPVLPKYTVHVMTSIIGTCIFITEKLQTDFTADGQLESTELLYTC